MKKRFGKNVREIRQFMGMTGVELAKRMGRTSACICQIEKGKRNPSLTTIVNILNVLNVKFERLMK